MADDPPKKEVPTEVVIPSAPSTTRGAIRYTNTITRKQFAQLSGAEPPQLCAVAIEAEAKAREGLCHLRPKKDGRRACRILRRGPPERLQGS